jgi:hypothetical protein
VAGNAARLSFRLQEIAMRGVRKLALVMLVLGGQASAQTQAAPEIAYRIDEGQNINAFLREGPVAAHLLLRSGNDPRILVAFPAGNSGVGLWFERTAQPATWRVDAAPTPLTSGAMHGIVTSASLDASALTIKQAVLSNVRFLRDYQAVGKFPAEVAVAPVIDGNTIRYKRARLDGAPGYEMIIRMTSGRIEGGRILAGADGRIAMEITALTGDTPLTPLPVNQLLNDRAATDPDARNALSFLSYREKFLAGSWRFNTYFGRDTLMSVRLLMPALRPDAIEAGLNSVLARLSPGGEVSHEEGISEFAIVQNRKAGRDGDTAEEDYKMVDDDYMLAAVLADYVAGPGASRAKDYLAKPLKSEANPALNEITGAALVRNLRFVLTQAAPFAAEPVASNLIAIKPGFMAGQWRDSDEGLGRGRYPYDVNAALVSAALDATASLLRQGLLDPYLSAEDRAIFAKAGAMARVWHERAAPFFRISFTPQDARQRIEAYAASVGVPAAPAIKAIGNTPAVYHAISLDAQLKPVPIVHSDEGFVLLFGRPSPAELDSYIVSLLRPFPAGLLTDIGLLTDNPAFVDKAAQTRFMSSAYHGAVVWSWQQALFAAGLERQLARKDLPAATRARLTAGQAALWRAIKATRTLQNSELWSWKYEDGRYQVVPFGAGRDDVDESNAAQLWSTVYLAVKPPKRTR